MADNRPRYGFRLYRGAHTCAPPPTKQMVVASGYANRLRVGDPVKRVADGSVEIAGPADRIYGVITGGAQRYNGQIREPKKFLEGGSTWTSEQNKNLITVTVAAGTLFEVDVTNSALTTEAAYRGIEGNNVPHLLTNSGAGVDAEPLLNLAAPGTADNVWRIERLSPSNENEDLTGARVKMIVRVNQSAEAPNFATGT